MVHVERPADLAAVEAALPVALEHDPLGLGGHDRFGAADVKGLTVTVDQDGFDPRRGAQGLDHPIGQRDPRHASPDLPPARAPRDARRGRWWSRRSAAPDTPGRDPSTRPRHVASRVSHGCPFGGCIFSTIRVRTISNVAPSTSGSAPRRCSIPWSRFHHHRSSRAARRAWASSIVGVPSSRAFCARSPGDHRGARSAHSRSSDAPATFTTSVSCASDSSPSAATCAIAGRSSSARAVATVDRTSRTDTPSAAANESSICPRSSSTRTNASSRTRNARWARTTRSRSAHTHAVERHRSSSTRSE